MVSEPVGEADLNAALADVGKYRLNASDPKALVSVWMLSFMGGFLIVGLSKLLDVSAFAMLAVL